MTNDARTDAETFVTYKREDGELIDDEFEWVTDLGFFEGDSDHTKLVKETWRLVEREVIDHCPNRGENCWRCCEHVFDGEECTKCGFIESERGDHV